MFDLPFVSLGRAEEVVVPGRGFGGNGLFATLGFPSRLDWSLGSQHGSGRCSVCDRQRDIPSGERREWRELSRQSRQSHHILSYPGAWRTAEISRAKPDWARCGLPSTHRPPDRQPIFVAPIFWLVRPRPKYHNYPSDAIFFILPRS